MFSKETPFMGELNGLGHTINGLYINRPTEELVGLIRSCLECKISNLNLHNIDITGKNIVGGLVANYIVDKIWYGKIILPSMSNIKIIGTTKSSSTEIESSDNEMRPSTGGVFGYVYDIFPRLSDEDLINLNIKFEGKTFNHSKGIINNNISGTYEYD
jgi:hypothetical protein